MTFSQHGWDHYIVARKKISGNTPILTCSCQYFKLWLLQIDRLKLGTWYMIRSGFLIFRPSFLRLSQMVAILFQFLCLRESGSQLKTSIGIALKWKMNNFLQSTKLGKFLWAHNPIFWCCIVWLYLLVLPSSAPTLTPTQLGAELAVISFSTPTPPIRRTSGEDSSNQKTPVTKCL